MPLVFIHGVNVRDRYQNENDAFALGELLADQVIRPLAAAGIGDFASFRLDPLLMRVPYWGGVGVQFRWAGATLPRLRATDVLGGEDDPSVPSEAQVAALADLLKNGQATSAAQQPLLQAARTDLPRFVEIVLAPIIDSEVRLIDDPVLQARAEEPGAHDGDRGAQRFAGPVMEALLITAAEQVGIDAELKQRINTRITTDDDLIDEVEKELLARFGALTSEYVAATNSKSPMVDALGGGIGSALEEATDRLKEFFVRVAQAPSRISSVAALKLMRGPLHATFTRFSGDVFEYLLRRGDARKPGAIVQVVLAEIDAALSRRPDEPLIVITHSMGGNIFYDVLTHFRPDLNVDIWLSVGGQVGLFEEMKLFHASKPDISAPQRIDELGSRVKCWLNIYDPADPAAFLAEPVFQKVKDVRFSTGAGDYRTHLNYFKRSRLYRTLRSELEEAFRK